MASPKVIEVEVQRVDEAIFFPKLRALNTIVTSDSHSLKFDTMHSDANLQAQPLKQRQSPSSSGMGPLIPRQHLEIVTSVPITDLSRNATNSRANKASIRRSEAGGSPWTHAGHPGSPAVDVRAAEAMLGQATVATSNTVSASTVVAACAPAGALDDVRTIAQGAVGEGFSSSATDTAHDSVANSQAAVAAAAARGRRKRARADMQRGTPAPTPNASLRVSEQRRKRRPHRAD